MPRERRQKIQENNSQGTCQLSRMGRTDDDLRHKIKISTRALTRKFCFSFVFLFTNSRKYIIYKYIKLNVEANKYRHGFGFVACDSLNFK